MKLTRTFISLNVRKTIILMEFKIYRKHFEA